jgi:hypothetical protein
MVQNGMFPLISVSEASLARQNEDEREGADDPDALCAAGDKTYASHH